MKVYGTFTLCVIRYDSFKIHEYFSRVNYAITILWLQEPECRHDQFERTLTPEPPSIMTFVKLISLIHSLANASWWSTSMAFVCVVVEFSRAKTPLGMVMMV